MTRVPVLAAGGIVLRQEETPRIAVVRLRKRNEWVLPKGKLDDGETPRDAAEREVLEETGHDVSVHEFLGTLVYESGGRFKVVHYWRMETRGEQVYELMDDIRAVDWLPLEAAVERLSRAYERAFLENVGPLALQAAAVARRSRAKKRPAPDKRRRPPAVVPQPSQARPIAVPQPAVLAPRDLTPPDLTPIDPALPAAAPDAPPFAGTIIAADLAAHATRIEITPQFAAEICAAAALEPEAVNEVTAESAQGRSINLVQKVRDWLRRAA